MGWVQWRIEGNWVGLGKREGESGVGLMSPQESKVEDIPDCEP